MLNDLVDLMVAHIQTLNVDVIVGVEARGFLFAPLVSSRMSLPFVPIRKKGKLPGETVQVSYELEYGTDICEAQVGSVKEGQRVCIIDDLIATGGTMEAACLLIEKMKGVPVECLAIIALKELQGSKKVHVSVHSIL